jgi:hypothetical protein
MVGVLGLTADWVRYGDAAFRAGQYRGARRAPPIRRPPAPGSNWLAPGLIAGRAARPAHPVCSVPRLICRSNGQGRNARPCIFNFANAKSTFP